MDASRQNSDVDEGSIPIENSNSEIELEEVDEGDYAFIEEAFKLRTEIELRSKGRLKVTPEVVAEISSIRESLKKEIIRLAILRSRTHKKDAYLLKEDVEWAHKHLVTGGSSSLLSVFTTTGGGLLVGAGLPLLVKAATAANGMGISPAEVGWGTVLTILGLVFLGFGFITAARRAS
ncbi:hypothetical protein KACC15558_11230 [Brevibacterium ammoniilyticum]|uniref:Uncharacterized protein n=1 Tax=Brevibacterium ammoniilyticum TaxID=1046555 RepID=A0ABP9U202_9MICO